MAKKIIRRSDCPVSYALDIIGDKWSLLIIRDLMFKGKKTYSEILNSEEGIATNILADRLSMLEAAGLLKSKKDINKKTRHIYVLTQKGIDLAPVMLEIVRWSANYDKKTAAPKNFVSRIQNDRDNLIKEITTQLKKTI
jgi:DNA-binding HxlR family transcriptional regulator